MVWAHWYAETFLVSIVSSKMIISATIHEFSLSWFNEVENTHEKVKPMCYRALSTTIIKKLTKVIYFGRMEIIILMQVSTGQYISEVF